MIKSAVAAPFIPISSIFSGHRGAQGIIYGDMIHRRGEESVVIDISSKMIDDINEYDRLYVYNGNDWSGSLNLYGGVEKFPYADNIAKISQFKGEVFSLAHDIPDYHYLLSKKIAASKEKIQEGFTRVDFDNLLAMQKKSKTIRHPYVTDRVTVGDSHGISMYRPGWTVNSVPYKTLYGALKDGVLKYVMDPYVGTNQSPSEIELYFGNIDVRHHLCRQQDSLAAARELASRYIESASSLRTEIPTVREITIRELLPIEDESRVIPKTGMYEGRGFWGSWEQRNTAREVFNDECEKLCSLVGVKFRRWTSYLLNEKGQLDLKHMEYKRSVHLSRMSYPHWQGLEWNEAYLNKVKKKTLNLEDFFEDA